MDDTPLTPEEKLELQQLEAELAKRNGAPIAAAPQDDEPLTPAEREELAALEAGPAGPSRTESLVRGAARTGLAGFADEAQAGIGTMFNDVKSIFNGEAAAGPQAKRDEFGRVTNSDELGDGGYSGRLDEARAQDKAAQAAHPGFYGTGAVAGAILSPVNKVIPGGGIIKGAIGGGAQGLIQGFGDGEGGAAQRLEQARNEGVTGAVVGGAAGAIGKVLAPVGRTIVRRVKGMFDEGTLKKLAVGLSDTKVADESRFGFGSAVRKLDDTGFFTSGSNVKFDAETGKFIDAAADGGRPIDMTTGELHRRAKEILSVGGPKVEQMAADASANAENRIHFEDLDLSDVENQIKTLKDSGIDKLRPHLEALETLVDDVRNKFGPGGLSPQEALEYKRSLYQLATKKRAFGSGDTIPIDIEAIPDIAGSVKDALEKNIDAALPEQAKLFAAINSAESGALKLMPELEKAVGKEAAGAARGGFGGLVKTAASSVPGIGTDATAIMSRAKIARSVTDIKAKAGAIIERLAATNPQMAMQAKQILKLPPNKMIPALQPFLVMFEDEFEPSPYPSLMDGKLHDPADRDSHRQYINENVTDPIQKAKELSALNKDGTIIGQVPQ